jgi:hypothetical protein
VHQLIHHSRWRAVVATGLVAVTASWSHAQSAPERPGTKRDPFLSMESWQEPINFASSTQAISGQDVNAVPQVPTGDGIISANPAPEATVTVPPYPPYDAAPPYGVQSLSPDGYCDANGNIQLGESRRDGGHPDDWSWGCGGSPYRTGPGFCDNWKVGCRWETYVDGTVMFREDANLAAIQALTQFNSASPPVALPAPDVVEQFDHAVGGRISMTGYMPRWSNYNLQAAFEGSEAWNAAIVYPKLSPTPGFAPDGIPVGPTESFEQRTVFLRSNLYSGELNFVRLCHPVWRPYCGVRFIKFDDEIRDFIDQEAPLPLIGPAPVDVTEIDRLNSFDIENNMLGFQVGVRRDIWRIGRMFSLQGFANAGVYHNQIKRTNIMSVETVRFVGDDTDTPANETGSTGNLVINHDVSDITELAYVAEGSVTAVCRLNRCVALRAGYQVMWINNIHIAEDDFLDDVLNMGGQTQSLIFSGWHAGVEYRR